MKTTGFVFPVGWGEDSLKHLPCSCVAETPKQIEEDMLEGGIDHEDGLGWNDTPGKESNTEDDHDGVGQSLKKYF